MQSAEMDRVTMVIIPGTLRAACTGQEACATA
jgi:hypothetical protein